MGPQGCKPAALVAADRCPHPVYCSAANSDRLGGANPANSAQATLVSGSSSAGSSAPIIADLMSAMQAMERRVNIMRVKICVGRLDRQSLRVEIDCLRARICQLEG